MRVYIRVFNSFSLIHVSAFMPIPCSFYYYRCEVELKIRDGDISGSSFIVQDCFSDPGLLFFHMKLSIVLSRFVMNCVGILM